MAQKDTTQIVISASGMKMIGALGTAVIALLVFIGTKALNKLDDVCTIVEKQSTDLVLAKKDIETIKDAQNKMDISVKDLQVFHTQFLALYALKPEDIKMPKRRRVFN